MRRFGHGYEAEIRTRRPTDQEVRELAERLATVGAAPRIGERMLQAQLEVSVDECAAALGNPQRAEEISPDGQGMLLYQELQLDSTVTVRSFCEWWLNMDFKSKLDRFMLEEFGSTPDDQEEDVTQRLYHYRIDDTGLTLSQMFATLEAGKSVAHIEEYSLRQTTLEQVFNQFARQQIADHHAGHNHNTSQR